MSRRRRAANDEMEISYQVVANALQLTVEELKQRAQEANEEVASEGIYINGVKVIMTATGEVIIVEGMRILYHLNIFNFIDIEKKCCFHFIYSC